MNIQLIVWQPRRTQLEDAQDALRRQLDVAARRFSEAYGHPFTVRCLATSSAVVGSIGYDLNTSRWDGWTGSASAGAVCLGAFEAMPRSDALATDPLARKPTLDALRTVVLGSRLGSAARDLRTAMALPGRWSVAAWDTEQFVVVNGAATGRSLWRTEGPNGWALGSLPRPVLSLVDRSADLDLDRSALGVALGYVAGWTSMYQGVRRLSPGERVVLSTTGPPVVDRPMTLDTLLGPRHELPYSDVVDAFTARVTELVDGELDSSANPRIGLSGGRDSRLLAAAAAERGRRPLAATGGPASSPDVVQARQVARLLGLPHTADADSRAADTPEGRRQRETYGSAARRQPMTLDRLAAWVELSDGTAPASLAWLVRDLSEPAAVDSRPMPETLTGLGGGAHRGAYYPSASDLDRPGSARRARGLALDLFSTREPLRRPVREILAAEIDATDGLADVSMTLAEWLSRFNWRFRQNCHGSDTAERRDFSGWTWSPLLDAGLLSISRLAPASNLVSSRLMEDATVRLAPQLAGVAYDRGVVSPPPELVLRMIGRLGLLRQALRVRSKLQGEHRSGTSVERKALLATMWVELYFGQGDHIWPELIRRRDLRHAIESNPDGILLKHLAVPELLVRRELAALPR